MATGYEEQTNTVGGLAAQQLPDVYFPQALRIQTSTPAIGTPWDQEGDGVNRPLLGQDTLATSLSNSRSALTAPSSQQQMEMPHWTSVLNLKHSPAGWILMGLLLLYAWNHVTYRKRGRGAAAIL